jgi:hypothetical protein
MIYVLLAFGTYTSDAGTGQRVELIRAYHSYDEALAVLKSETVDVSDPQGWGPRGIDIQKVELVETKEGT